ncbi:unnamed protein product [Didymodactylos carnosus]|uniref:Uncharacterized protein n=1 Tax=Didymodactylos carnosus TaxID=1234261 RepID=A0A814HAL8_9BILA|nr:unnamed protein product [Didymodactylos carnosus]CAF3779366.1 unnamed protein product [Didymodactylos carnosus]
MSGNESSIVLVHSQFIVRNYVIKQDLINTLIYNEFSVYDSTERNLLYRINTQFSFNHQATIKLILPRDDFIIIGKTDAQFGLSSFYGATFQLLNTLNNRWEQGRIKQLQFQWGRYVIEYQGRQILMETDDRSPYQQVWIDLITRQVYAQYQRRVTLESLMWQATFDLKIYTNELPDTFYLIGLAIVQRSAKKVA